MTIRHVRLEARGIGAYVGRVSVLPIRDDDTPEVHFDIPLDALYSLRLHVDNAIRQLTDRMLRDAIAGACDECRNTRMVVTVKPNGSEWIDHCPRCTPVIDAAIARLNAEDGP